MRIYKLIYDAKMLSGYIERGREVVYLVHEKEFTQEQFESMVSECYETSNFYHKESAWCISKDLIKKYGFKPLTDVTECRYLSTKEGITINENREERTL